MTEKELRQLDVEVAGRVFGWRVHDVSGNPDVIELVLAGKLTDPDPGPDRYTPCPRYSKDVRAAWTVLTDLLVRRGVGYEITGLTGGTYAGSVRLFFADLSYVQEPIVRLDPSSGGDVPSAICKAALRILHALGEK